MADGQPQLNIPAQDDPTEESGYPRRRFFLLLALLGLMLTYFAVGQFSLSTRRQANDPFKSLFQADSRLKAAYAGSFFAVAKTGARSPIPKYSRERARLQALLEYRKAVGMKPAPSTIRKLIILEDPRRRDASIRLLTSAKYPKSAAPPPKSQLQSESDMWRAIYVDNGSRLSATTGKTYEQRIRRLGLGWYDHLALADLYTREGDPRRSQAELALASRSATELVSWLMLAFVVVAILVLLDTALGIVLLVAYSIRNEPGSAWNRFIAVRRPIPDMAAADIGKVPGYLLEAFIFYMAMHVIVPLAIRASGLVDQHGGAMKLSEMIYVDGGLTALIGVTSLAYLWWRMNRAGWRLSGIGFVTRKPLRDVFLGIGGYALALPIFVAAGIISIVLTRGITTPENTVVPYILGAGSVGERVVIFLLLAVAAPVFEELFFRGVLFNCFGSRWGALAGVLLSSVVFGLVHPLPMAFLPIFTLGAAFSLLAYRSGSLVPGMVAHSLHNSLAYAMMLLILRS